MHVIDAHVHLYPPEVNRGPAAWAAAWREPHWAEVCTRRRKSGVAVQSFPGMDELLREMDAAGVERAVMLGWYWNHLETCIEQNRFYAGCVRAHPDRFAACATVQPAATAGEVLAELHRTRDQGFVGLGELSPHSQGYRVDAPVFQEVLALAGAWRWPVNLHVTDPDSRDFPGRVETPLNDFARLALTWPQVSFVLAHWGGLLPLRDANAAALPNLHYDSAASPLMYDDSVWSRFFAAVPSERILFGSDHPLNLFPKLDAEPGMARFVAEANAAGAPEGVMRANALRLFQL